LDPAYEHYSFNDRRSWRHVDGEKGRLISLLDITPAFGEADELVVGLFIPANGVKRELRFLAGKPCEGWSS
jgi:hypothetical protein